MMAPKTPLTTPSTALLSKEAVNAFEEAHSPGLVRVWPFDNLPELISLTTNVPITIGRDESCDVVLDEESVSRQHATLRAIGTSLEVKDLGSSNGSFIDERQLDGIAMALPGDLLRFGRCIFLLVKPAASYKRWWTTGSVGPIVGGPSMGVVRKRVTRFATMDDPVLISGETGTGKEVIARELHDGSDRNGAFVAVNCAAVPDRLFEDQFFGHLRGAFTGADRRELGFFKAASGGTLFLDEVGELELASQPKLLRALEAHEVIPLGATQPEPIDVRIISATNRDLSKAIETELFRADLYSRLRVLSIPSPPLRERPEDILLLAQHFILTQKLQVAEVSHEAAKALVRYFWPGNARELRNVLVEASASASTDDAQCIGVQHLRPELQDQAPQKTTNGRPTEDDRTSDVIEALRIHKGNVAHAAEELGLHRAQIYKVLRAAGIKASSFRSA